MRTKVEFDTAVTAKVLTTFMRMPTSSFCAGAKRDSISIPITSFAFRWSIHRNEPHGLGMKAALIVGRGVGTRQTCHV
jgi:hypothetical protein